MMLLPEAASPDHHALIQAHNELKEKLFGAIAHDLLGPIGALRECLELASVPGFWTDEELRTLIPEMQKSADATFDLAKNLVGWLRSQMEAISALKDRIVLKTVAERVASAFKPMAQKKQISVLVEVEAFFSVIGDSQILETILTNLVSNAVKYSYPGTTVLVQASAVSEKDEVRLCVRDQGVGMSSELVQNLFTMAKNNRHVGTSGERGSGIGLVFCQELANAMDAKLVVESELGHGSTITLILPQTVDGDLPQEDSAKESP